MIVCICKGISESQLRGIVRQGTMKLKEVQAKSCAGLDCGTCVDYVKKIVDEESIACVNAAEHSKTNL